MRYIIEEWDDLWCVFRVETIGMRIVASFDTLAEARECVIKCKGKEK